MNKLYDPMESLSDQIRVQQERVRQQTEGIIREAQEKKNREIENNESLKQIVQYNKMLTDLNERMLLKMNLVNGTLEDVLNSIGSNEQRLEKLSSEQLEKLSDLKGILESNAPDKNNKILSYFAGLSGNIAVEMFAAYLKYKFFGTP